MEVAFWSNSSKCGVTSFAVAAGIMCAQMLDKRVILLDNHFSKSRMADVLLENRWSALTMDERLFLETGKDTKIKFLSKHVGKKAVKSSILEIIENRLWLGCGEPCGEEGYCVRRAAYRPFYDKQGVPFEYELCIVDTESHHNISTKDILDKAGLVVIMLPDRVEDIDALFREYSSIKNKALFVLNRNISVDRIDPGSISKRYDVADNRIIVVPYNEDFEVAVIMGRIAEYILSNYNTRVGDINSDFVCALRALALSISQWQECRVS